MKLKYILNLSILLVTIVYGSGDYFGWWDRMSGRSAAIEGYNILSNKSVPILSKKYHQVYFSSLTRVITQKTKNHKIRERIRDKEFPMLLTRIGAPIKPMHGDPLPERFSNPDYVPDSLPVVYVYFDENIDLHSENLNSKSPGDLLMSVPVQSIEPIGTLSDLRRWIEEARNRERFVASIVLIGLLSFVAFWNDFIDDRSNGKRKEQHLH